MSFEPVIGVNGLSQLAVGIISIMLALKMRKEKGCLLERPFYLLAMSFFMIAVLNILWASGMISVSGIDNTLVLPFFHLAVLAVWFYIGIVMSGHDHTLLLIPVFIMSINAMLLFRDLAVISDVITGLMIIGVFFYIGFVNRKLVRRISLAGMVYGFALIATALLASLTGSPHLYSFWFVPNAVMFFLLFSMMWEVKACVPGKVSDADARHHIPLVIEVFKLGLFVVGLSIFLMLGTLGVHELGHSLAAKAFGCEHETSFGIGYAKTHVVCESDTGSTLITLAGFIMTVIVALLLFFMGHEFSQRLSLMILAFSMMMAVDDFSKLGMPDSIFIIIIFASAVLIGYGLVQIVKNYEKEYAAHEGDASMCASAHQCEGKVI